MPIWKKIVEIPESEITETFAKQFIIAFDKVNRHERLGSTSIECVHEIDIITKKNDASYAILANINDGGEHIYAGHAQVTFNKEELSHYQINIPKLTRTVEICRIVEKTLDLMNAHKIYEEFYKTPYSQSVVWRDRDLIEEGREFLISELFAYTEKLQKEFEIEKAEKARKKLWNLF